MADECINVDQLRQPVHNVQVFREADERPIADAFNQIVQQSDFYRKQDFKDLELGRFSTRSINRIDQALRSVVKVQ